MEEPNVRMTETERVNKDYREGKISPWDYYLRVKQDAEKSAGKNTEQGSTEPSPRNGRLSAMWSRLLGRTPVLA
jgi:hypothetical protein